MKDEQGKITFDTDEQAEVDRVVEERINRERGKYTDYDDVKGVLEELNAYGFEGNAKEVRQAVKAQREEGQRQQELQELQQKAQQTGTSPELLQEMASVKKELAELKKERKEKSDENKAADQQKVHLKTLVDEFQETYPDINLNELNNDEDFIDFLKGSNSNLSLVQVYQRYEKYSLGAVQKATAKIQSNNARSTSSGKARGTDSGYGLSSDQRSTVDDWNKRNPKMKMTYQEFKENLRK